MHPSDKQSKLIKAIHNFREMASYRPSSYPNAINRDCGNCAFSSRFESGSLSCRKPDGFNMPTNRGKVCRFWRQ
jgi:hypothetical protein